MIHIISLPTQKLKLAFCTNKYLTKELTKSSNLAHTESNTSIKILPPDEILTPKTDFSKHPNPKWIEDSLSMQYYERKKIKGKNKNLPKN